MSTQQMWFCEYCGSTDLVRDAWVTVNHTEEEGESIVESFDDCFCRTCEQTTYPIHHRKYIKQEEYCTSVKCTFFSHGTCTAEKLGLRCVPYWLD